MAPASSPDSYSFFSAIMKILNWCYSLVHILSRSQSMLYEQWKALLGNKMQFKDILLYNQNSSSSSENLMITLWEWERTVVCKQLIAARATSLLPFKMLFFTKRSRDSHPAEMKHNLILVGLITERTNKKLFVFFFLKSQIQKNSMVNIPDQKLLKLLRKGKKDRNIRAIPPRTSTSVSSHCFWAVLRLHIH